MSKPHSLSEYRDERIKEAFKDNPELVQDLRSYFNECKESLILKLSSEGCQNRDFISGSVSVYNQLSVIDGIFDG